MLKAVYDECRGICKECEVALICKPLLEIEEDEKEKQETERDSKSEAIRPV